MDTDRYRTRLVSEAAAYAYRQGWHDLHDAILASRLITLERDSSARLIGRLPVSSLSTLATLASSTRSFRGGEMPGELDWCFEWAMRTVLGYTGPWLVLHFDVCGEAQRAA